MSSERPINPRFDEDVHFNLVSPGPARYQNYTEKPVRYFAVVDKQGGAVLGYVWANDEDDAAMWEPREAAGPQAFSEEASGTPGWRRPRNEAFCRHRPSRSCWPTLMETRAVLCRTPSPTPPTPLRSRPSPKATR